MTFSELWQNKAQPSGTYNPLLEKAELREKKCVEQCFIRRITVGGREVEKAAYPYIDTDFGMFYHLQSPSQWPVANSHGAIRLEFGARSLATN